MVIYTKLAVQVGDSLYIRLDKDIKGFYSIIKGDLITFNITDVHKQDGYAEEKEKEIAEEESQTLVKKEEATEEKTEKPKEWFPCKNQN